MEHTQKRILARGCDPVASAGAAQALPPIVGNPEYVPTTTDEEFFRLLETEQWSVVFFAPGACRFSAARAPIPGGNAATAGWTLEDYRTVVQEHQGDIPIVETLDERETVRLLGEALAAAADVQRTE